MSDSKKLLKNSGIYGIVSILQKCIGLILIPIYTNYITPEGNGIISVVTSITAFLSVLYTLSLNGSINRYYFDYKDDEEKLKEFWGTNILFILINSFALTIILIIGHKYLLQPFAKDIDFYPYILLGLVSITLNPMYTIHQSILQTKQEAKKYGANNLAYFVINIGLNILFIVGFSLGAKGVLLGAAITDVIFFLFTAITFIPEITFKINKEYLKKSLKYSVPLIPHTLAGWTMAMVDKLLLNGISGAAAAGIYNIGFQFGNIINIFTTAVNQAYVPWFFDKMGAKEKNEKEIIKIAEIAVFIYGFLAMGMSLFGPEVLRIFAAKSYRSGWMAIPFIAFAYVFNGIYFFFVNTLFYNKKGTKFVAVGTFTAAILNVIFNAMLIPKYGFVGSSLASLLANLIASILVYRISIRIEKIRFNVVKIYAVTLMFLGISLSTFFLEDLNLGVKLLVKTGIVMVIMLYVYMKNKETILNLKNIFTKKTKK